MINRVLAGLGVAAAIAIAGSLINPLKAPQESGAPERFLGKAQIDPATLAIVERACQSCHSEQTKWPWYSHVAPVSWLIARDVQQARAHMNLSRWDEYSSGDRDRLLSVLGSAVRNRAMPPQRYLLLHPEARLTGKERQQLYQWARTERSRLRKTIGAP